MIKRVWQWLDPTVRRLVQTLMVAIFALFIVFGMLILLQPFNTVVQVPMRDAAFNQCKAIPGCTWTQGSMGFSYSWRPGQ